MELRTLASGSSGNCILLSHAGEHILIDAGISCRRITQALSAIGVAPEELLGVFITHEHSDHMAGLSTLYKKYALPVYTAPRTGYQLCYRMAGLEDHIRPVTPEREVAVGGFSVKAFPLSHDAAQPQGYAVTAGGRTAAVATDLGHVTPQVLEGIRGAGVVVCESNHDVDWLTAGPYPPYLKLRILGERGHLSNEAGAALALECVKAGAHSVILGHLSAQNNTPARALEVAGQVLRSGGVDPERDIMLAVAPRDGLSPCYEV